MKKALLYLFLMCFFMINCTNPSDNVVGWVRSGQEAIQGVLVSDGTEVVQTDRNGYFHFKSEKEDGYVFVSIPSGYGVERDGLIPSHFARLKNTTGIDTLYFDLNKVDNDTCDLFIFTDLHLTNDSIDNDMYQFERTFYPDITAQIKASKREAYTICLGDMTTDSKWYVNNYGLSDYLKTMGEFPTPIYHIMGNHDNERKVIPDISDWDFHGESTYKKVMGPNYYSLNIGSWHLIMLDNIITGGPVEKDGKKIYQFSYRVDDKQMEWIKKDLSFISRETPIMVCMHAPPLKYIGMDNEGLKADYAFENAKEVLACFAEFKRVEMFAGHTHKTNHYTYNNNISIHNLPSASAISWKINGEKSRLICEDGSPAGYWIVRVEKDNLKWQFKSNERPIEKSQFIAYDLNCVPETFGGKRGSNEILINIFNWDPAWSIRVKENDKELDVKHCWVKDPLYSLIRSDKDVLPNRPTAFLAKNGSHMFQVVSEKSDSDIEIYVTDRFGNIYEEVVKRPKAFSWDMQ